MSFKNLIFVVFVSLLVEYSQSCGNTCDNGWINYGDLCYSFFPNPVVKENAKCPSGSSLVTIFSKETQDFLSKTMKDKYIQSIWLDAKINDNTMVYQWSNTTQVNNSFWCVYYPSFSQFKCVILNCLSNGRCCFQDKDCDHTSASFVCQKRL